VLSGNVRTGTVFAASGIASYARVPASGGTDGCAADIVALLSPGAVRLPLGVCLTGRLPVSGTEVRFGNGEIATAECTWRPVRWWDPRPRLATAALLDHAHLLLDVALDEPASAFGLALTDAFDVTAALAAGDGSAAVALLGFGPGLTPSADDVVAGAFAVLALLGRLDDSMRSAVLERALTHTTALSAALLAAAGRGQMIPQAARVLNTVANGEPPDRVRSAARDLFQVGSTSGHDLCAGMTGALVALSPAVSPALSGAGVLS
jgi:hypothetical protein